MRFALFLASQCEQVTVWAPVRVWESGVAPPPGSWRLDLGGVRIAHHDWYNTFASYYRLWLRRSRSWRRHGNSLVRDHDIIVLWHPSPMIGMISKCATRFEKPLVVVLAGDMRAQSDRILASGGIKRLLYRMLMEYWVRREVRFCQNASLLYAYNGDLAARHASSRAQVKLMRSFSQLSLDDFIYREDTCGGPGIRLLRVCWLVPSKGIEYLLEGVSLLIRQGMKVELEIVGKERVVGYQAGLENLAKRLGIGDQVRFSGWVAFDQIQEAYLRSDIQVISSLAEGTPRVIFEGAARGLPLVSTNVGGIPQAVQDGFDALLVPAADPVAVAEAVRRVVQDGTLRRKLIEHGYASAREASFERVGVQFVADLQSLTAVGA